MGAAAIDAVFVPGVGVHEGLDEEAKGVGFIEFPLLEQIAQRLRVAAALSEVLKAVVHAIVEEALDVIVINELAHGAQAFIRFDEIADGGAIGIATGERGEVIEGERVI